MPDPIRSVIIVHPDMDAKWPCTADHFHALWRSQGRVEFLRLQPQDARPASAVVASPETATRLAVFGVPVTAACVEAFGGLREIAGPAFAHVPELGPVAQRLRERGVRIIEHCNYSSYWAQSVAEFGLALTLCGLRGIHDLHARIIAGRTADQWGWYTRKEEPFASGTVERKRVRIVGAGNIASRYGSWMRMLGAEVAACDPFASEPCFHRAGMRREWHLDRLVRDADIFAPMAPLTDKTRGMITARLIDALPKGCLVVLVTRAEICDMAALRRRVLADELALAADVFDLEPLPKGDPLIGRHNVVHTPHAAGSTRESGLEVAESLADQFLPVDPEQAAPARTAAVGRGAA